MKSKARTGTFVTVLLVVCGAVGFGGWGGEPESANPCNWPDYCGPATARLMLDEILDWASQDHAAGRIDTAGYAQISDDVFRCMDPNLTNCFGQHVCEILVPEPCQGLAVIHADAFAAHEEKNDKTALLLWAVVENEFPQFPGDRGPD